MVYSPAPIFQSGVSVLSEEDSVVKLVRKFLNQMTSSDEGAHRGRLESGDQFVQGRDSSSLRSQTSLEYDDMVLQQQDMIRAIERCLSDAKGSSLRCQVLHLPRQLIDRVARDVVRSSRDEPCGLRGASIRVYLERKDAILSLGSLSPDPSIIPTFELSVVFKVDNGWPPLKHIFVSEKALRLRPEYRLIKQKLYTSEGPVIHDFY